MIGSFSASVPLPRQSAAAGTAAFAAIAAGASVAAQPALGLLAVATMCGVLALLVWPEWATIVVVLALFADVPSVLVNAHGAPPSAAALLPFLLLLPLAVGLRQGRPVIGTPLLALLAAFFLAEVVSTLQAADTAAAVDRLRTLAFEGVLTYALVTNVIRDAKTLRRATAAVVAAAALLGGLALWQQLTHGYFRTYGGFASVGSDFYFGFVDEPRLQGPIGDPNYFAQVLLIAVPLGLLLGAGAATRARRWTAVACAGLATAGVVLTQSRGAVIALAVVVLSMACLGHIRRRHVLLLAVAFAVTVAAVPSYRDRVASLVAIGHATSEPGAQAGADQSVRARSTEMRAALLAFDDHPILGVGPGNFPAYYQDYAAKAGGEVHARVKFGPDKGSTPERQAHNLFLSVAADLGALGLAIFVAMLVFAARMLLRARRRFLQMRDDASAALAAGYFLALLAYVTSGLFLSLAYERYLWLLLALAAVTAHLSRVSELAPAPSDEADSTADYPDAETERSRVDLATLHTIVTGRDEESELLTIDGKSFAFSERVYAERVVAHVSRAKPGADLRTALVTERDLCTRLAERDEPPFGGAALVGFVDAGTSYTKDQAVDEIAAAIVRSFGRDAFPR